MFHLTSTIQVFLHHFAVSLSFYTLNLLTTSLVNNYIDSKPIGSAELNTLGC